MSFKEGSMETIDKLTFLSQILIKKNKKLLESVLKGSKLVDETMVKTIPEKIDDGILLYLDKCNCMKVYFDEDGWKTCIDTMACKKQQCTCETCHKLISGTVVCCSTCKK